jgi:hypothetical protein
MKQNSIVLELKKAREKGYKDGIQFAVQNYSASVLLCLKDKFDFTSEELEEAVVHINDIFDSITKGYLSLDDITETLIIENDFDMRFQKENPSIGPDSEKEIESRKKLFRKLFDDFKIEHANRSPSIKMNIKQGYYEPLEYDMSNTANRDPLIEIITQSSSDKEDLDRRLRKAGYLD